jgi:radical SAM protein with 4Fe4S-binding SPASM domain
MIGVNPDGTSHYCDRYNEEYQDTYVMNNLTDYDFLGLHQLKRALDFNLIRHNVVLETGCDTCYAKYICDGGCMAFQRSKYGKNGIDKRLVCPLHMGIYSYIMKRLPDVIGAYIKFNKLVQCLDTIRGLKDSAMNRMNINIELEEFDGMTEMKFVKKGE